MPASVETDNFLQLLQAARQKEQLGGPNDEIIVAYMKATAACPSRALGRKVSDEFTVPLCRGHHREVHRCGDEAAWWRRVGVDPSVTARALWLETHPPTISPNELVAELAEAPAARD